MDPSPSMTGVLRRKENKRWTHGKKALWWRRQRLEWCVYKSTNAEATPGARRKAWNRPFPRAFKGSVALLTPWFQILRLQNCKRINFYCFNPPSLWNFVFCGPRRLILLENCPQAPAVAQGWIGMCRSVLTSTRKSEKTEVCHDSPQKSNQTQEPQVWPAWLHQHPVEARRVWFCHVLRKVQITLDH